MKPVNYISEGIYISDTKEKGRGVFTRFPIKKNIIVEIAPVIVLNNKDRLLLDQTALHDYIFEWDQNRDLCCMALGYVPLYNHSYHSNCEYEMNFQEQLITIRTVQAVPAGKELCINYNGDWNNIKPLWFQVK